MFAVQVDNRHRKTIDGRRAIDEEHRRFRKFDDVPNLAGREGWIETGCRRPHAPSREQVGEKPRSATMSDGNDGSAPDAHSSAVAHRSPLIAKFNRVPAQTNPDVLDPAVSRGGGQHAS